MTNPWEEDPEKLQEQEKEEKAALFFGISVEQLRQQRRDYGQLVTGHYAGCDPAYAEAMELIIEIEKMLGEIEKRE